MQQRVDQEPMLEQAREISRSFNNIYGNLFVEPEAVLPENVNGFLSDYTVGAYSDKIIEVMTNKELYDKVSKNAYIDLYKTWDQMVNKAYELYQEAIEKKCN